MNVAFLYNSNFSCLKFASVNDSCSQLAAIVFASFRHCCIWHKVLWDINCPSGLLVYLPVLSLLATENPEDGEIYLLVLAQPGCPGQSPESHKMVVVVVVVLWDITVKYDITENSS